MSDAATFEALGSDGTRKTVHVLGVVTTGASTDCFGAETLAWAGTKLTGTVIHLGAETAEGVAVALADGQDYATLALQNGYLKSATAAASGAETAARQAAKGFWGPPCNGSASLPAPPAPQQPTTMPPAPSTKAAPKPPPARTTTEEPPPAPEPDTSSGVYYKNCAAAKAAHAAPLHIGQPGYRAELDRDHDGVACET
ncbi:excalibur calcium-binding domain-containing protein [Amycolatopsis sp. NBC_00438]|uniref:excalibur calcium-binding domain-containing protein n=1 Tax=Amycolatopsis sp. NBC_00438 TaxID=2903558 RepID=UPI002E1AFCFE